MTGTARITVLIESDWNLKCLPCQDLYHLRIRINRIRLEFKDNEKNRPPVALKVLIESDWNLKEPPESPPEPPEPY